MSWFSVLKNEKFDKEHNLNQLRELENKFNTNQQKAIGYIPISWATDIEEEIKTTASKLGLQFN